MAGKVLLKMKQAKAAGLPSNAAAVSAQPSARSALFPKQNAPKLSVADPVNAAAPAPTNPSAPATSVLPSTTQNAGFRGSNRSTTQGGGTSTTNAPLQKGKWDVLKDLNQDLLDKMDRAQKERAKSNLENNATNNSHSTQTKTLSQASDSIGLKLECRNFSTNTKNKLLALTEELSHLLKHELENGNFDKCAILRQEIRALESIVNSKVVPVGDVAGFSIQTVHPSSQKTSPLNPRNSVFVGTNFSLIKESNLLELTHQMKNFAKKEKYEQAAIIKKYLAEFEKGNLEFVYNFPDNENNNSNNNSYFVGNHDLGFIQISISSPLYLYAENVHVNSNTNNITHTKENDKENTLNNTINNNNNNDNNNNNNNNDYNNSNNNQSSTDSNENDETQKEYTARDDVADNSVVEVHHENNLEENCAVELDIGKDLEDEENTNVKKEKAEQIVETEPL